MSTSPAYAQDLRFSTHDWTIAPGEGPINEAWADAKMPGGWPDAMVPGLPATTDGRRTYVVGSIDVREVQLLGSMFSGVSALPANSSGPPFTLLVPNRRQVVMVQASGGDTLNGSNTISWQRYFYGSTGLAVEDNSRATNGRAISVWEADLAVDVRIAICGETYDERLPASQAPAGWLASNGTAPSGFIAVLNGAGVLQWSHHFFAGQDPAAACAVTDLSIRVDAEGNDIVTYCGIFSHGDPGVGTELSPLLPFAASAPCSGGATVQAAGQWDGFVGRLSRSPGASATRQFHSIVGGPGQDGLFGLAEIDANRFAVVGSTQADAGQGGFPLPYQCGLMGPYVLGAVMVFDATPVASSLALLLESATEIGSVGEGNHTMARDVAVGRGSLPTGDPTQEDLLFVVGSTDQVDLPGLFAVQPPVAQSVLQGPTDGFVAAVLITEPTAMFSGGLDRWTCNYQGGSGDDGLTGISAWNEFSDHMTVTGFTDTQGTVDIDVATYFFNNAIGPVTPGNTAAPNGNLQLLLMRQTQIGGDDVDRPTVMGVTNTTSPGLFNTYGLGQPTGEAGGGVAVGPNGRCNVVGYTRDALAGYPAIGVNSRAGDEDADAVRSELDMLPEAPPPLQLGVGRTDGTGFQAGLGGTVFPPALATGFTGGTTPFCSLSQFGDRIGDPAVNLQRMLIDFEGDLQLGSTNTAVVVTRPNPQVGTVMVGVLQFGIPPATPWAYLTGTEMWLGGGTYSTFPVVSAVDRSYRMPLPPLTGGLPISAQMICFVSTPVGGAGVGCSSMYSASPAIWFSF